MNILDLLFKENFAPRKVAAGNGGEYACACPWCSVDGKPRKHNDLPDRFRIWPELNRYWCRGCDRNGDAIQFLREFKGLSFAEACEMTGKEISENHPAHMPKQKWQPAEGNAAVKLWSDRAVSNLAAGMERIRKTEQVLAWLRDERFIDMESVGTFHLGYYVKDIYEPREAWGLPPEMNDQNKPRKIWIPKGLMIPCFRNNSVVRLRIRRDEKGADPRYIVVAGSSAVPLICNTKAPAVLVVESELDAILCNQEAGDLVTVIALGSVSKRPDIEAHNILMHASMILLALDAGEEAGSSNVWGWWRENYPQSRRCYIPMGKDPTDAMKNGLNIRTWIKASLGNASINISAGRGAFL